MRMPASEMVALSLAVSHTDDPEPTTKCLFTMGPISVAVTHGDMTEEAATMTGRAVIAERLEELAAALRGHPDAGDEELDG